MKGKYKVRKHLIIYTLIVCMLLPTCIDLVSGNQSYKITTDIPVKSLKGVSDCWKTIPDGASLYDSPDGVHDISRINEKLGSKDSYLINQQHGETVYVVLPLGPSQTNYYFPSGLSTNPCVTGIDFMDFLGKGLNQWVFQLNLKPHIVNDIITSVSALALVPFSINGFDDLFAETMAKTKEKSRPSYQFRWMVRNRGLSISKIKIRRYYSKDDWVVFEGNLEP